MVHFGWLIVMFVFGITVGVFFSTLSKFSADELNDESDGDNI